MRKETKNLNDRKKKRYIGGFGERKKWGNGLIVLQPQKIKK